MGALPEKPRRSAIFLAVTAEESGLRGSEYYGQHPVVPAGKTAAALNFDMFMPFGRASRRGADGRGADQHLSDRRRGRAAIHLAIKPDPRPEAGTYYRSDHFSFARVGIPSFSIEGGEDLLGKPAGTGKRLFDDFEEHPIISLRMSIATIGIFRGWKSMPGSDC